MNDRFVALLSLTVPQHLMEHGMGYPPDVVGETVAAQVIEQVRADGLAYYPSLDYWDDRDGVDPGLLALVQEMSWHAREHAGKELRKAIGTMLPTMRLRSVQSSAYLLPGVRRRQANALFLLGRHYSPQQVRIELDAERPQAWSVDDLEAAATAEFEASLPRRFDRWECLSIKQAD